MLEAEAAIKMFLNLDDTQSGVSHVKSGTPPINLAIGCYAQTRERV